MKTSDGGAKNYLADDTPVSNPRANLNSKKMEERLATTDEIYPTLSSLKCCDIPQDAFISVIAPRRSGKSTLVESLIHEYRKKHKVDAVFLFSKTDAGFYQIPKQYRFRTLEPLNEIIDLQIKVKRFNQKQRKESDKISSKVIVILDDMIDGNGEKVNVPSRLSLSYTDIFVYNIKAVQELYDKVKILEQEIQLLKNK